MCMTVTKNGTSSSFSSSAKQKRDMQKQYQDYYKLTKNISQHCKKKGNTVLETTLIAGLFLIFFPLLMKASFLITYVLQQSFQQSNSRWRRCFFATKLFYAGPYKKKVCSQVFCCCSKQEEQHLTAAYVCILYVLIHASLHGNYWCCCTSQNHSADHETDPNTLHTLYHYSAPHTIVSTTLMMIVCTLFYHLIKAVENTVTSTAAESWSLSFALLLDGLEC